MRSEFRDEKLEAAILSDRTREQAWLVYADFLQDRGDPRGELASLQAAKLPAADKFLWARREHFFGPLAPMLAPFKKSDEKRAVTATWRHGWMDSLRLSATGGSSSGQAAARRRAAPCRSATTATRRLRATEVTPAGVTSLGWAARAATAGNSTSPSSRAP
jgi:uncharacterized protein (TIGR02996 family)